MVDSLKPIKISARSRRVVESLAETIIPSEGPERPGALDVNLVDRLMGWLKQIPGSPTGVFVVACWMWEFSPLWSGRFSRLSSLSPEDRARVLEGWEGSRLFFRRWVLLLTKLIFMAGFYSNEQIWPLLGYEPGCLSEPKSPIEER